MTAYDFMYMALLILLFPLLLWDKRLRRGFFYSLSRSFESRRRRDGRGSSTVIVHSVSVGEVNAALPLVRALEREGFDVLVSTATERGFATVIKSGLSPVSAPLDFSFTVRSFLREYKPVALILIELEMWPNLLFWAYSFGIPVVVVNGRISSESFRNYIAFRSVVASILRRVSLVLCQNNLYVERFVALGADKGKVFMGGNLKYDSSPRRVTEEERKKVREELSVGDDEFLLIGGSTYLVEEKALLDVFVSLRGKAKMRLLLAPRQADHFDELCAEIVRRGLRYVRRSETKGEDVISEWDVYVVDTVGDLLYLYGGCDVSFVGGTLFEGKGGHSVIEPAACGIPVIVGEHHENFKESVLLLAASGGLRVVKTEEELRGVIERLMNDSEERKKRGESCAKAIDLNRGATERVVSYLKRMLER
ncbi:MAG: hypothetical protein N2234_07730 [Planctomycetota bacterium]|nr:hypothetical protein [Planctomycetota bacterium]